MARFLTVKPDNLGTFGGSFFLDDDTLAMVNNRRPITMKL